jgi:hypothetical protein
MAVAAEFIAKLLARFPWITWIGLLIIHYVAPRHDVAWLAPTCQPRSAAKGCLRLSQSFWVDGYVAEPAGLSSLCVQARSTLKPARVRVTPRGVLRGAVTGTARLHIRRRMRAPSIERASIAVTFGCKCRTHAQAARRSPRAWALGASATRCCHAPSQHARQHPSARQQVLASPRLAGPPRSRRFLSRSQNEPVVAHLKSCADEESRRWITSCW